MSPAHVLEPTYEALRQRLLSGRWPAGQRLEAMRLADNLGVSITPVRDSLNRLVGERLVHALPGDGFRVPRLDTPELQALLNWHEAVITIALQHGEGAVLLTNPSAKDSSTSMRSAFLFAAIAKLAGSPEVTWACDNAAARLSAYRKHESEVLPDVAVEIEALETAARHNKREDLTELIGRYHLRRSNLAGELTYHARVG